MKKIIYIFIGCLLLTSCSGMLDIESHSAVPIQGEIRR